MPTALSKRLGVDSSELTDKGAFDPILDLDTHLFIDPHLLKYTKVPEFQASYEKLQKYFKGIGKLLLASDQKGDPFWRKADLMMKWPEFKGLCIGYSAKGTSGSGTGAALRKQLLETAKLIIDKGKTDPELFELIGIFENNFGPDRISDMTANIIKDDFVQFSKRVFGEFDFNIAEKLKIDHEIGLPINPFTDKPIYLIPRSILRDLPVALEWSHLDKIIAHNEELRQKLNSFIGESWRDMTTQLKKTEIKDYILKYPELFDDLVTKYTAKNAQPYNFLEDRAGEYIWYHVTQKLTKENPIKINLSVSPTIDEVENVVLKICEQYKNLIENNNLCELLYNSDGNPKHEKASQLLFYGVSESYCEANKIMIARESDSGRGPVDFKFGTKFENSVLVEVKKSTNTSGLKSGIEKQLPEYMKSEKSKRAIYLVIDVGFTKAAIERLETINRKISGSAIKIIKIDGRKKHSASKMQG